jgi:gephyrin
MFSKFPMIPVEEAKSLIQSSISPIKTEKISLSSSLNRILAEDIHSPIDFPPFRASTMDGYALRSSDSPGTLLLSSPIRAGDSTKPLPLSHCLYITTGAALPSEADSVVPVEDVEIHSDRIKVPQCKANQFIRQVGSDICQGQLIGSKGSVLTAQHLALLASVGLSQVLVKKAPVVGVLSTGSELKDVGQVVQMGQIIDSNRLMLKLLLQEMEVEVRDYGIVQDDFEVLRESIKEMSSQCDLWVSSGGVSMGDKDFVKPIIELEGQVVFGRVNMKPGKPMTFGKIGNCLAFALPGNPVSCFVCFYLFVRLAVDHMLGLPGLPVVQVDLNEKLRLDPRPEYHRAVVIWENNRFLANSTGAQQSSRLLSTVRSNCILMIPAKTDLQSEITGQVKALLLGSFESVFPEIKSKHRELKKSVRNAAVITVSDRAFQGVYEDTTGPYLKLRCEETWNCQVQCKVVPDELEEIKNAIIDASETCDVVFTTGGTGMAPRDVTPEATLSVIEKNANGLVVKMINDGLRSTEFACLSRQVAGIRGRTLIINFPGSPGGVKDCFESISGLVAHIVFLIKGD